MLTQGRSRRTIARYLGWGSTPCSGTRTPHMRQDAIPDNQPRSSRLDPYEPYLERRFAEGCTSVTRLHGELIAEQAPVTCGMVRAHIATLRRSPSAAPPRPPTAVDDRLAHPTRHGPDRGGPGLA